MTEHSRPQSLRSFWPAAGIESSGSNHFEITKEITEFCPSGLTQPSSMAHARNGCSQSSRFLPQARRIVSSGDKNGDRVSCPTWISKHDMTHRVRGRHLGYASLHRPPSCFICIRIRAQTTNQNAPFGQRGPTQLLFCTVKERILKLLITS